jgi:hypothetical protein
VASTEPQQPYIAGMYRMGRIKPINLLKGLMPLTFILNIPANEKRAIKNPLSFTGPAQAGQLFPFYARCLTAGQIAARDRHHCQGAWYQRQNYFLLILRFFVIFYLPVRNPYPVF